MIKSHKNMKFHKDGDFNKDKKYGSAVHHWMLQRVTALLLLPMSGFFIYFLLSALVSTTGSIDLSLLLATPSFGVMFFIFFSVFIYHSFLGIQVIIEDYCSCIALQRAFKFCAFCFMCISILMNLAMIWFIVTY